MTVGLDISHTAIKEAHRLHLGLEFRVGAADVHIPFSDCSFDGVFTIDVLEHVFDVAKFIQEIWRVLNPGGHLFVSTPYHGLVKNLIVVLTCFDRHFDPLGEHIRFFTPRTLRMVLERASFGEVRIIRWGRFPPVWRGIIAVGKKPVSSSILCTHSS
mgnify:CR=1 FL=1